MSYGFSGQALCLLLMLLAPCLGQSPSATRLAVYVLDIDTNMKGEFSLVAPELTEALQTAFSEKRSAFNVLERRHLDQLVKANQLEKDLQAISRGEPVSAQIVRQVRADGFIRGNLIDSPDGVVLTVTLVDLNSEVMWQGQASESRAGWLLHETQKRNATKLAAEAEERFKPSNSSLEAPTHTTSSSTAQIPSQPGFGGKTLETPPTIQPGTFVTASYLLSTNAVRKDGSHITLSLTAESLSDKPIRFVVLSISCYLLDENGNRWNQESPDSAGFAWSGVEIDPGMKVKSSFSFVAKDTDNGTQYSLICPEASPQQGRRITIRGINSH
jgi:hypothetical protein